MVFGTAFLIPRCATASTKRLWSCGVHTSRGLLRVRAGSSPAVPEPSSPESAKSAEEGRDEGLEGGGWGCCCC